MAKVLQPGNQLLQLADLVISEHNPRDIDREAYGKLKQSLLDFPEMLQARGIVVDTDGNILGGTQRVRALLELGEVQAPGVVVDWSEEQRRRFMVQDNHHSGTFDFDKLTSWWTDEELVGYGMDDLLPQDSGAGSSTEKQIKGWRVLVDFAPDEKDEADKLADLMAEHTGYNIKVSKI